MKLLSRGRWPRTEGPTPRPSELACATPGLNNERFRTPAPVPPAEVIPRSWAKRSSKVDCSCAVVVSMIAATPDTSTVSVAAPGLIVTFNVPVLFSCTSTCCATDLKPCELTVSLYIPTGRLSKRYPPVPLVLVLAVTPVATFCACTSAFATTAPEGSVTVPVTLPLIACPKAPTGISATATSNASASATKLLVNRFIRFLLRVVNR